MSLSINQEALKLFREAYMNREELNLKTHKHKEGFTIIDDPPLQFLPFLHPKKTQS